MWLRWPLRLTKENINIYMVKLWIFWLSYENVRGTQVVNWFHCCNFGFLPLAMMRRRRVMQYENWAPIKIFVCVKFVEFRLFRDGGSNPREKKDRKAGPLSLINQNCQRESRGWCLILSHRHSANGKGSVWEKRRGREGRRKKEKVVGVVGES